MSKNKILICDDSEVMTLIIETYLGGVGYEVFVARNTDEVYNYLKSENPEIILLDLNLPEDGGLAVLKKIKEDPKLKIIPVLLFSGENNLEEIAKQNGANGFIQKPFKPEEFLGMIEKNLHLNS